MSELPKMLREAASGVARAFPLDYELCAEAADELDRLSAALAESEADRLDQARLNGMGSEREAKLLATVDSLTAENEKMQTALEKIACSHVAFPEKNFEGYAGMAVVTARAALAPTDQEPAPHE